MSQTINQLDKELETMFTALKPVNTYRFTDFNTAYKEGKVVHPAAICMTYTGSLGKNYIDLILTIVICDKVFPDDRNQKDTRSDMLKIAEWVKDIIYTSPRWNSWTRTTGDAQISDFVKQGADLVDGWEVKIPLRLFTEMDLCAIPLDDYDLGLDLTPSSCEPVTIIKNGEFETTVPSGGTFQYETSGGPCDSATVHNSDNSYLEEVASGGDLELPDQSLPIYLDGELVETVTYPAMTEPTIDIIWD